jgi:hypothetical protein
MIFWQPAHFNNISLVFIRMKEVSNIFIEDSRELYIWSEMKMVSGSGVGGGGVLCLMGQGHDIRMG